MSLNRKPAKPGECPPEALFVLSPWYSSRWKRIFDVLLATLLLLLAALPMLVIAVLVKLTSPGPVLFRQPRPGKDAREFCILKFRSMIDSRPEQGPVLTRAADPRITKFGGFMRRWKLDELPQLFNVLRGEMSFVGPRPQPTKLWQRSSIQGLA